MDGFPGGEFRLAIPINCIIECAIVWGFSLPFALDAGQNDPHICHKSSVHALKARKYILRGVPLHWAEGRVGSGVSSDEELCYDELTWIISAVSDIDDQKTVSGLLSQLFFHASTYKKKWSVVYHISRPSYI